MLKYFYNYKIITGSYPSIITFKIFPFGEDLGINLTGLLFEKSSFSWMFSPDFNIRIRLC